MYSSLEPRWPHTDLPTGLVMALNMTCLQGNSTACEGIGGVQLTLAVVLPLLILLVVVTIALMYTQRNRVRSMWTLDRLKSTEFNTHQPEGSHYSAMVKATPASDNSPIYENYTQSGYRNRSTSEPEDIYLQCDSQDDAIYNNDPSCSLTITPSELDEDLYVMPDVL
ncbi:hypothetical protein DPEC_G00056870 [Dallia pectoralis]|uniref:Uncharacterized protein n=1 Tax=Dallia pectoralis TaxID=75939 RepID=A0ACC2H6N9_DALPE|nr:hypothetical protein DPEC_G00056870 [Dallia pectoralis]